MQKIRYALIGWGWRAEFYYRIARLVPERFELTGVLCRSREKGEELERKYGVKAVYELAGLLSDAPDFVVLCIKRGCVSDYLLRLFEKKVPVLAETPPAESVDELNKLWQCSRMTGAKVQIAEQYLYQPLYAAWQAAIRMGLLGAVQNINLSALHGYHGVSVIRNLLGAGFEACTVIGKQYTFQLTRTLGREGPVYDGQLEDSTRNRLTFEFESGKTAFFDFSDPAQYHSFIRTRQLNIQGTRGEIDDLTIRYLDETNQPVALDLNRVDLGVYNNQEWAHAEILLGEKRLYRNPFPGARLNDDEIAVATCLIGMSEYLQSSRDCYSLADALQDTYLSLMMDEAMKKPYHPIRCEKMPWGGLTDVPMG